MAMLVRSGLKLTARGERRGGGGGNLRLLLMAAGAFELTDVA